MRFANVVFPASTVPTLCVISDDQAFPVAELYPDAPATSTQLVAGGDETLERIRTSLPAAAPRALTDVSYDAAVNDPPVVFAIGLNYAAHSGELGLKTDSTPTVFGLWPNSLTGHERTTSWPRTLSEAVDYEAELGVIIGTAGTNIAEADALDHVWGYTVVNDITARNVQFAEAQWSRAKSFDGFTPVGPVMVTKDEIADVQDLRVWTIVDGHTVQDGNTSQMVRSVAKLIAHLSTSITLMPGTLISTGSPGGAGYSRDPQIFLRDRSTVTVGVDGIGELTTHCRITD